MKKIALIALLATAGMAQVAYAQFPPPSIECPAGTYPTPAGHCQPDFEFD
ncbi:hypothetical protein ACIPZF_17100 [Pseudomonas sp. NPDC089752]